MPNAVRIPAIARDRRFLALWAAQSVSTFGDSLTTVTLILLVIQRTHSVASVGALTVAIAVPSIVIGLLSGAYVDRHDRRRIMITSAAGRAVLLAALAILALSSPSVLTLCLVAFLQATVGTFANPARAGLLQIVIPADEQVRANSLIQTTTVTGELAGTTLGGVLVAALHVYWISFTIDAATFALSAVFVATIRPNPITRTVQGTTTWSSVTGGLRAVRSSPVLRGLLLVFGALAFALSPMAVLLAPYVVDTLHISAGWIGVIQSGDTAGNILGGVVLTVAAGRLRPRALTVTGMLLLAGVIASLAWATTVPALVGGYFMFGLITVMIQTGMGALAQSEVDNALMGRFTGLMAVIPGTVSVLGVAFGGALGAALGVRPVFAISGAVLAISTVLAWHQFRAPTPCGTHQGRSAL